MNQCKALNFQIAKEEPVNAELDFYGEIIQGSGGIKYETDPTVPAWAKEPTKPSYTADEVGAVPITRKIADIPLDADISVEELKNGLLKNYLEVTSRYVESLDDLFSATGGYTGTSSSKVFFGYIRLQEDDPNYGKLPYSVYLAFAFKGDVICLDTNTFLWYTISQSYTDAGFGYSVRVADNYATKEYVDGLVGDIETALDSIIAIQENLIGGATE